MLLDDFFHIKKISSEGSSLTGILLINKEHRIFEGHFPSIPIVPGVCMMQMIKEVMGHHLGRKFLLRSGDNVKFLSVINPGEHSEIEMAIQYEELPEGIKINASLFAGATIFLNLKQYYSHYNASGRDNTGTFYQAQGVRVGAYV